MYTVASTPAVTGFYAGNQFTVFLVQHKIYKQFKSKLTFQNKKNRLMYNKFDLTF